MKRICARADLLIAHQPPRRGTDARASTYGAWFLIGSTREPASAPLFAPERLRSGGGSSLHSRAPNSPARRARGSPPGQARSHRRASFSYIPATGAARVRGRPRGVSVGERQGEVDRARIFTPVKPSEYDEGPIPASYRRCVP
jgi:hypothetical protein